MEKIKRPKPDKFYDLNDVYDKLDELVKISDELKKRIDNHVIKHSDYLGG